MSNTVRKTKKKRMRNKRKKEDNEENYEGCKRKVMRKTLKMRTKKERMRR